MKHTLLIVAIIAVSALSLDACSSIRSRQRQTGSEIRTSANADQPGSARLRTGMSETQVRDLWGKPREVTAGPDNPDVSAWTYERREAAAGTVKRTIYRLRFERGILVSIEEQPL